MPLFFALEASPFFSQLLSFVVIKGWTRASSTGLDPSWCGVLSVVPLLLESLFPLILSGTWFVLSLVVEFGLNPHILGMVLNGPSFPV